jgi:hypothetical protein
MPDPGLNLPDRPPAEVNGKPRHAAPKKPKTGSGAFRIVTDFFTPGEQGGAA